MLEYTSETYVCRIAPLLSDCLQSHCGGGHVHLEVADKGTRARNIAEYQSGVGIS